MMRRIASDIIMMNLSATEMVQLRDFELFEGTYELQIRQ